MLKQLLIILTWLLISGSAYSNTKDGRIYLNIKKDPCSGKEALYYRTILKDSENSQQYLVQDYYMDGKLQASFQVKSDVLIIDWLQYKKLALRKQIVRDGFYRTWYSSGQLKFEAHYSNNQAVEAPKYWLENGERAFYGELCETTQSSDFIEEIDELIQRHLKNIPQTISEEARFKKLFVDIAINKQGEVCYVEAQNSIHPQVDAEAVRAIQSMPKQKPATLGGKKINMIYTVPICF